MKLNPQRRQRIGNIARRLDKNGLEAERPRTFDVRGEIVEEYDARGRHADRAYDVIKARGVRLPVANRRRVIEIAETVSSVSACTFVK